MQDTGLTLTPDTNWHTLELIADFANRKYVSASVDGVQVSLADISLAQLTHTDWGTEVALNITTESMATYPGDSSCSSVFTWTTQFRNLEFVGL